MAMNIKKGPRAARRIGDIRVVFTEADRVLWTRIMGECRTHRRTPSAQVLFVLSEWAGTPETEQHSEESV